MPLWISLPPAVGVACHAIYLVAFVLFYDRICGNTKEV